MKLYCVRHCEACDSGEDPERPLTEKGFEDANKVAEYLGRQSIEVAQIMHSGILRAQQTAEIYAQSLQTEQVTESKTLLAESGDVLPLVEMVRTWSQDTLIVGHLPFMYKLVSELVMGDQDFYPIVNFPPGAVVCLEHYEHERWIINWVLRPSIVPEN